MSWIERMETDPRIDVIGPVEAKTIDTWCDEAGIDLPIDYRSFVLRFGCGDVGDDEVYGFGVDPKGPPSLPFLLDDLGDTRPAHLLPVVAVGDGSWISLAVRSADGLLKGQVCRWKPWESGDCNFVASSFGDYIEGLLDAAP